MSTVLSAEVEEVSGSSVANWEKLLDATLPLYGHRNWLVVADAAYPAQSRPGIQTILSCTNHQVVIEKVLALLRASRHVRPTVHLDKELAFVEEADAPGAGSYRSWLVGALQGLSVSSLPHEEIISMLDRAGQMFSITVIKTDMTIPYTAVFFELDCAYWDSDSEKRMRAAMRA